MTKVAFIGLGTMGLDMARNVIEKGHAVVGYDPSDQAMKAHVSNGGSIAESPADAANGAQIVKAGAEPLLHLPAEANQHQSIGPS